jgi:hypothetical protein
MDIEDPADLRVGARVHHPRYGDGVVRSRTGMAGVVVAFEGRTTPLSLRAEGLQLIRE